MNVSPLTLRFDGSISAIAGYPKQPYPRLNKSIWEVKDSVGINKVDPRKNYNQNLSTHSRFLNRRYTIDIST